MDQMKIFLGVAGLYVLYLFSKATPGNQTRFTSTPGTSGYQAPGTSLKANLVTKGYTPTGSTLPAAKPAVNISPQQVGNIIAGASSLISSINGMFGDQGNYGAPTYDLQDNFWTVGQGVPEIPPAYSSGGFNQTAGYVPGVNDTQNAIDAASKDQIRADLVNQGLDPADYVLF